MREYLDEVERASAAGLYYVALSCAIGIPDLCGALEALDGEAKGDRYVAWFDRELGAEYAGYLSGAEAYKFRCSLIHQGRTTHPESTLTRILFVDPDAPWAHKWRTETLDGEKIVVLDISSFATDVITAARRWLDQVTGTEPFETNLDQYVRLRPHGWPPGFVGVPLIT